MENSNNYIHNNAEIDESSEDIITMYSGRTWKTQKMRIQVTLRISGIGTFKYIICEANTGY